MNEAGQLYAGAMARLGLGPKLRKKQREASSGGILLKGTLSDRRRKQLIVLWLGESSSIEKGLQILQRDLRWGREIEKPLT